MKGNYIFNLHFGLDLEHSNPIFSQEHRLMKFSQDTLAHDDVPSN